MPEPIKGVWHNAIDYIELFASTPIIGVMMTLSWAPNLGVSSTPEIRLQMSALRATTGVIGTPQPGAE